MNCRQEDGDNIFHPQLNGAGVHTRMASHILTGQHIFVDEHLHLLFIIEDKSQDACCALFRMKHSLHLFRRCKRQVPTAYLPGYIHSRKAFVTLHYHKEILPLLVHQEQVLARHESQLVYNSLSFFHRCDRSMRKDIIADA